MPSGARWYPKLTNTDTLTQQAWRRAFDAIYDNMDAINTVAAAHNSTLSDVQEATSQAQSTQQKIASLPSFDVLQSGSSPQLKVQSSILPAHCTGFSYTSTTTSITFYWDGTNGSSQIQIAWPDGSVTKVPLAKLVITGLTPGTTYHFYPAFNTGTNMVTFSPANAPAASAVGSPAVAYAAPNVFAASAADGDRFQSLYSDGVNGMQVATPSTGTGSGSAGGK